MSYTPPFSITPRILNLVANISEQVGMLKSSLLQSSPQLRKQNRIKTIAGTLAIEGNTLTESQITAILDGQHVMGSMHELTEVRGAIQAYEALPSLNPSKVDDLLKAHHLMMAELLVDSGTFRQKPVGIHKGGEVIHMAPPAHRVSGLIAELLKWLAQSEDHPLITSSVCHYEFEFIHPFMDGNGRMGRLWQTLILSQWHPLFLALPLESIIKDNQQGYYDALEQSDSNTDCCYFLIFMLTAIEETLRQNAPVNAPVNLKTPEAILQLLHQNNALTRRQMADHIGKDIRTIGRALQKLQAEGKLKRQGSDKQGHWEITTAD